MPDPEQYKPTQSEVPLTDAQLAPYITDDWQTRSTHRLLTRLDAGRSPEEMVAYVGTGHEKDVFVVRGSDGAVALKRFKTEFRRNPTELAERMRASATPIVQGAGIGHLEQLVALDPDRGIMVTTFMPGKPIANVPARQLGKIKERHLIELSHTLATMRARGLHHHQETGILFDRRTGFNFVDYQLNTHDIGGVTTWNDSGDISSAARFLAYALSDFAKIKELQNWERYYAKIPDSAYETTGLRGAMRARIVKRAQQIENQ